MKTYREERNRAESEARRQRANLDKMHAKAKAEIERIVGAIAKGIISDDEAVRLLGPARAERERVEAKLATAESFTNVVELHPQAVQRFKENIEELAAILTTPEATPDLTLIGGFRSLVEAVIVQPREAGQEYEVRIRGHLAALMGAEVSAVVVVARGRYLQSPRQILPEFSITAA